AASTAISGNKISRSSFMRNDERGMIKDEPRPTAFFIVHHSPFIVFLRSSSTQSLRSSRPSDQLHRRLRRCELPTAVHTPPSLLQVLPIQAAPHSQSRASPQSCDE